MGLVVIGVDSICSPHMSFSHHYIPTSNLRVRLLRGRDEINFGRPMLGSAMILFAIASYALLSSLVVLVAMDVTTAPGVVEDGMHDQLRWDLGINSRHGWT